MKNKIKIIISEEESKKMFRETVIRSNELNIVLIVLLLIMIIKEIIEDVNQNSCTIIKNIFFYLLCFVILTYKLIKRINVYKDYFIINYNINTELDFTNYENYIAIYNKNSRISINLYKYSYDKIYICKNTIIIITKDKILFVFPRTNDIENILFNNDYWRHDDN